MEDVLKTRNEIEIFNNENFGQIRTIVIDGEPWFIGKDIAIFLERQIQQWQWMDWRILNGLSLT